MNRSAFFGEGVMTIGVFVVVCEGEGESTFVGEDEFVGVVVRFIIIGVFIFCKGENASVK